MVPSMKSWGFLGLSMALALAVGYLLPRPMRNHGDLLDAVAAIQRSSPHFLMSERLPPTNWVQAGILYLCTRPRSAEELDSLPKHAKAADPRWKGVVCFRGTSDPRPPYLPWVSEGGDGCLDYGQFTVYGDPQLLQEVRTILAAAGFSAVGNS